MLAIGIFVVVVCAVIGFFVFDWGYGRGWMRGWREGLSIRDAERECWEREKAAAEKAKREEGES